MDTRPLAIILDRDGTLASVHCGPEKGAKDADWAAFNASIRFDRPVPLVVGLLRAIRPGVIRIMVSGRSEGDHPGDRRRRFAMQDWIVKHQLPIDYLFMRCGGDKRLDSIVKEEILLRDILPRFNPVVAVDDREVICQTWEKYGISVVRVNNPGELPMIGEAF